MSGKGDRCRSFGKKYWENYAKIFGEKPLNNTESKRKNRSKTHKVYGENISQRERDCSSLHIDLASDTEATDTED